MFVIDASIALSWCFEDEISQLADAVLARMSWEDGVVPAIWPLEMANALRTAERRARIDPARRLRAERLLLDLPISVEAVTLASALGAVTEFAKAHDLTAYDAAYLELAARMRLPLATVDERLRAACGSAGIELVQP